MWYLLLLKSMPDHIYTGSYPQQAMYPQQSTAPIYPPAMQVPPPQVPPYTDAPPAYSEVRNELSLMSAAWMGTPPPSLVLFCYKSFNYT